MKTPREILLNRHQSAGPKLDAIRESAVAAVYDRRPTTNNAHERRSQTAATMMAVPAKILWRELIFPSRRIWAGLATAWIFIFIVNFSLRDHSAVSATKNSAPAVAMMSFKDQQKFVNELFADRSLPVDSDRPKIFSPKPRTETAGFFTV